MTGTDAAGRFVDALHAALAVVARQLPGGWTERRGNDLAVFTGLRIPNLNAVLCYAPEASPADVAPLLERVRATGVPYCLQLRPGSEIGLSDLAKASGMSMQGDLPAMVLENPSKLAAALVAPVTVRVLDPEERDVHVAVAAEGFEVPVEVLAPLVDALVGPEIRLYVGAVDDEHVVTGVAIRVGDAVGVFNVATPPRHRRRGYATALSARAVLDGFSRGATWAFLQSSPMAHRMYEGLGFRTVERWELWVGGQAAS